MQCYSPVLKAIAGQLKKENQKQKKSSVDTEQKFLQLSCRLTPPERKHKRSKAEEALLQLMPSLLLLGVLKRNVLYQRALTMSTE